MPHQKKINMRAVVSIGMTLALIFLALSGLLIHSLHGARAGRIYHTAITVHNASAVMMVAASLLHAVFNFRMLKRYFSGGAGEGAGLARELVIVLVIAGGILVFFVMHAAHH